MKRSPEYLRTSTAAAITLKLQRGRFYRNAALGCINLLLEYPEGCAARCSYCGLSHTRPGNYSEKSFIRVKWPLIPLDELINQMLQYRERLGRVCISMITHPDAVGDTETITRRVRHDVDLPVSLLICPTIVTRDDLHAFHRAGADRIGIAVDAATPYLFARHRGKPVNGPHDWDRYWECFDQAVTVFGVNHVGTHLMVGLGETEREMVEAIVKTRDAGGFTHLFSFYPEEDSPLADREPPPLDVYRRIQLARYLIDERDHDLAKMQFSETGKISHFGYTEEQLSQIIDSGKPFETSGCPGADGEVACNRPFANSLPGPDVRNLPYKPNQDDLDRIKITLGINI